MNLQKLFLMQSQLDKHIEEKHQLRNEDLAARKLLALLVEIGELANETRCFKFWSVKPPAEKEVILEEFVDGVHFLLSLGIEKGFSNIEALPEVEPEETVTDQFLSIYSSVSKFQKELSKEQYIKMFASYIALGRMLGFSSSDFEEAYVSKNEINFKRQEQGY